MFYVAIHTKNNAPTIGLVLWKIRQVFEQFPREYHILVADDCSSDDTADVLEPYQQALPLTVFRHDQPQGYAACIESLCREALSRSERVKRDSLITLPADFSVSPEVLPELIRRMESGADVVVGESDAPTAPWLRRLVRRMASRLLRPGLQLTGVNDVISGVYAFRLVTLKGCLRERPNGLLDTDGTCANAELLARTAARARQITVVSVAPGPVQTRTQGEEGSLTLALSLFRAGRTLKVPAPETPVQRAS